MTIKLFQSFTFVNASINLKSEASALPAWNIFPNGIYKTRVAVYDDLDDNIVDLSVYNELLYLRRRG